MRIELPEYSKLKAQLKKSAPVKKTHEKKNFKGIQQSQEVAVFLVRHSLKDQSEALKERIKERKLNLFKRRQSVLANVNQVGGRNINKTVIDGINGDHRLDSPNMSRSKFIQAVEFILINFLLLYSQSNGHNAEEWRRG